MLLWPSLARFGLSCDGSGDALALDPNDQQAVYHLIIAFRKTDKKDQIPSLLKRLVELRSSTPGNQETKMRYRLDEAPTSIGQTCPQHHETACACGNCETTVLVPASEGFFSEIEVSAIRGDQTVEVRTCRRPTWIRIVFHWLQLRRRMSALQNEKPSDSLTPQCHQNGFAFNTWGKECSNNRMVDTREA
jgi:hypothetical protein